MKSIRLLFIGLLSACLFSCSNDDILEGFTPHKPKEGKTELNFNIGLSSLTRVSTDAAFKSRFEDNDAIGLFIVKSGETLVSSGNYEDNRKLTYTAGEWTLEGDGIYLPVDGSSLTIYAYYPYVAGADPTNLTFEVEADQSQSAAYNKSDFLLAKAENQIRATVDLQFAHALSLVQVEVVKGSNMTSFDQSLTVTLMNCYASATVDLASGTVSANGTTAQEIVMRRVETDPATTKYNYRALVPAQSITANTELFFFKQETVGKEINNNYIEANASVLAGGKVSKWKITVEGETLPEHNYSVGDVYPFIGTPLGLVYEVWNDGKNGKVISTQELRHRWGTSPKDELGDGVTWIRDADNGKEATRALIDKRREGSNFATDYAVFYWLYNTVNEDNLDGIWYIPSKNELRSFYAAMSGTTYSAIETSWIDNAAMPDFNSATATAAREAFNEKMKSIGGTEFNLSGQYWASTEIDSQKAWSVHLGTGIIQNSKYKYDEWGRGRPIMEF